MIWHIWHERNKRIHEKSETAKVAIFKEIETMTQLRIAYSSAMCSSSSQDVSILRNWGCEPKEKFGSSKGFMEKTKQGMAKLNTDGCLTSNTAGVGLLRDEDVKVLFTYHSYCHVQPVFMVELQGALIGLTTARDILDLEAKIWVEIDSKIYV